jgi:hypothetical protein
MLRREDESGARDAFCARTSIDRRMLLQLAGAMALGSFPMTASADVSPIPNTLLSVPMEVTGAWPGSLPASALQVVLRMREACLSGVRLVSDRQPNRILVDDRTSGTPAIWLHEDPPRTAWILVDIGARDWSKLAYQFGHELGHVLCNSWMASAKPQPPSQWLEEATVEAFSLRGLGRLATGWEQDPPFAGDNAFGAAIRQYRQDAIDNYAKAVSRASYTNLADWCRRSCEALEQPGVGLSKMEGPALLAILAELENDDSCVVDMGALNLWPERSALPVEEYLTKWEESCRRLGAAGRLPARLRTLLHIAPGNGG